MSHDGSFATVEPLDYAGTTKIFSDMLLTPWKSWHGPHPLEKLQMQYTLHSMKATLLSFGPQLGSLVSDSDRLLQGHHQDPKQSLNLHGRDSVWGSLRYQQTVIAEIQRGWRPKTAQHGGGQFPILWWSPWLPWRNSRKRLQITFLSGYPLLNTWNLRKWCKFQRKQLSFQSRTRTAARLL